MPDVENMFLRRLLLLYKWIQIYLERSLAVGEKFASQLQKIQNHSRTICSPEVDGKKSKKIHRNDFISRLGVVTGARDEEENILKLRPIEIAKRYAFCHWLPPNTSKHKRCLCSGSVGYQSSLIILREEVIKLFEAIGLSDKLKLWLTTVHSEFWRHLKQQI